MKTWERQDSKQQPRTENCDLSHLKVQDEERKRQILSLLSSSLPFPSSSQLTMTSPSTFSLMTCSHMSMHSTLLSIPLSLPGRNLPKHIRTAILSCSKGLLKKVAYHLCRPVANAEGRSIRTGQMWFSCLPRSRNPPVQVLPASQNTPGPNFLSWNCQIPLWTHSYFWPQWHPLSLNSTIYVEKTFHPFVCSTLLHTVSLASQSTSCITRNGKFLFCFFQTIHDFADLYHNIPQLRHLQTEQPM